MRYEVGGGEDEVRVRYEVGEVRVGYAVGGWGR